MKNYDYYNAFESIGVPLKPLPTNYSPEEFGRMLLSETHFEKGVSYATSTDSIDISKKPLDTRNAVQARKDFRQTV